MARKKESHIRLDDHEYEQVKARAESLDMPIAKYMRYISVHGEIKEYDMKLVQDVRMEMRRIGTNINQIAHIANASQYVTDKDYERLKSEISDLHELVDKWLIPLDP